MSRRKKVEEHENHERWLVSYADFITLLFAFFVVLYATSNRNDEKEKQFEDSVKKYMHIRAAVGGGGPSSVSSNQGGSTVIEPIDLFQARPANHSGRVTAEVKKILDASIKAKEKSNMAVSVMEDRRGVRIVLNGEEMFGDQSLKFKPQAIPTLAAVASVLAQTPYKISIEGSTSTVMENSWDFAATRASAFVRYLTKVHGIEAGRFTVVSRGNEKPADNVHFVSRLDVIISISDQEE